jgi:hypothetical protein
MVGSKGSRHVSLPVQFTTTNGWIPADWHSGHARYIILSFSILSLLSGGLEGAGHMTTRNCFDVTDAAGVIWKIARQAGIGLHE